jgi:hypothetical protein
MEGPINLKRIVAPAVAPLEGAGPGCALARVRRRKVARKINPAVNSRYQDRR